MAKLLVLLLLLLRLPHLLSSSLAQNLEVVVVGVAAILRRVDVALRELLLPVCLLFSSRGVTVHHALDHGLVQLVLNSLLHDGLRVELRALRGVARRIFVCLLRLDGLALELGICSVASLGHAALLESVGAGLAAKHPLGAIGHLEHALFRHGFTTTARLITAGREEQKTGMV